MKTIDKIIVSPTPPSSKNVAWFDGKGIKVPNQGKWESSGGGIEIVESVDELDPNAPVGSMASVVTPGSMQETSFRNLYQPDMSMFDQTTGTLTQPELLSSVGKINFLTPTDYSGVETVIFLVPRTLSQTDIRTMQLMTDYSSGVLNAVGVVYINQTTGEQEAYIVGQVVDGVYTINDAVVTIINDILASDDWCYLGYEVLTGEPMVEEQFATLDKVAMVIADAPSQMDLWVKKDAWEKFKITYVDITNPPKIPTKVSDLIDDKHLLFLTPKEEITGEESTIIIRSDEIIKANISSSGVTINFTASRDYSFARLILTVTANTTITASNFIWLNEPDIWDGTYIIDFCYSVSNEPKYAKVEKCISPYIEAVAAFNSGSNTLLGSTSNVLKVWIDGELQEVKTKYDMERTTKNVPILFLYGGSTLVSRLFYDSRIDTIYIPDFITTIGYECFRSSLVNNIYLGRGIKAIGNNCFDAQSSYSRNVYITDLSSFMKIDFTNNRSNPLFLYNSSGSPYLWLNNVKVTDIVIPEDITHIKDYVFAGQIDLKSITIHKGVTEIGNNAFNSSIDKLIYEGTPSDWNKIIHNNTSYNGLTFTDWNGEEGTVLIDNTDIVSEDAFRNVRSIKKVILGDNVKYVGNNAFSFCTYIREVIFGSGITQIGNSAFDNGTSIYTLNFSSAIIVPTLAHTNAFYKIPSTCKIIVPDALYDEWIAAENWSTYASNIIKKSDWDAQQVTE